MNTLTSFAWAAGFIDGEGYITVMRKNPTYGIRKSGPNVGRPRRDGTTYWLNLVVVNRNPVPLQRLVELFGGSSVFRVRKDKRGYWHWRLGGDKALSAIELMLPFLVGKREIAAVGVSFQRWYSATKGENGRSMTSERRQLAEQYCAECRRLIRLHRDVPEGAVVNRPATAEVLSLVSGSG